MGLHKRRAFYPSGPYITEQQSESVPKPPNPDPANYKIIKAQGE